LLLTLEHTETAADVDEDEDEANADTDDDEPNVDDIPLLSFELCLSAFDGFESLLMAGGVDDADEEDDALA
jgi:hypothetical protein